MKNIFRIIALALTCLMLIPALAACNLSTPASTGGGAIVGDTEQGEILPELLPDGTRYDGYEFNVIIGGNFKQNDFASSEDTEDQVDQARYKRNAAILETYGVTITFEDLQSFGKDSGSGPAFEKLNQSFSSESYDYAAGLVGAYDVSAAAYNGYLHDLNASDLPYLDLQKPWWDRKANDNLEIEGRMFYTAGSISLTSYIVTSCMIFNKDIVEEREDLLNPYELVNSNKWTWDNFSSEIKKVSEDLDGNGTYDKNDLYGLLTWNDALLSSFASSLSSVCSVNDEGKLALTAYTTVSADMIGKYVDLIALPNVWNYQVLSINEWDTTRTAMFNNDQVLYYISNFNVVPKHRDSETDFGILPLPKHSEEQEEYGHLVTASSTQFFCLPYYIEDLDRTGGLVEALAYMGYTDLVPAYYEKTLVGKYVRDDESVTMLDIIFASRVYDLGLYYKVANLHSTMIGMASSKTNTFSSIYEALKPQARSEINQINSRFRDVLGE